MSALAVLERVDSEQAWRACLQQRPHVAAKLARQFPALGSAEIEEAVDGALTELLESGSDAHDLVRQWSKAARRNLLDATRAPRVCRRVAAPIEDLQPALISHDHDPPAEEIRGHYRSAEALAHLSADERRWASAA